MGPAALLKLFGIHYFSFTVFGYSQILMDLEPLFRLIRKDDIIHGQSHSYAGAIIIGLLASISGKYLCELGLKLWNVLFKIKIFNLPTEISWRIVFSSAYIGTFSHVFLDSIMHADMRPLWPLSNSNSFLYWISISHLHTVCLLLGLLGGIGLFFVWVWTKLMSDERT